MRPTGQEILAIKKIIYYSQVPCRATRGSTSAGHEADRMGGMHGPFLAVVSTEKVEQGRVGRFRKGYFE